MNKPASKDAKPTEAAPLPDPAEVAKTYAQVAERASKLLGEHVQRQLKRGITPPADELGIAQAFMDMTSRLLSNPYKLAQAQMGLVWDYYTLWQQSMLKFMGVDAAPVVTPVKGDNRFRGEEWESHFLFDFFKQSYLISARHIHDVVSNVEGMDEHTLQKVNFFTRQTINAFSPSNFALTNPEVLRETVRSHGQNLLKGFNNLLRDIEDGDGQLRVRMTDTTAFELGRNVATTQGKVVGENALMQLLQFNPTTEQQFKRPLLIVPPWINKYYILDLRESNSYIKWATDQGHTVFVISWVNPDEKLAQLTFEDYVQMGPLAALDLIDEADRRKRDQRCRLLPRRHAAGDHAGLPVGEEGQADRQRHLLHHADRLLGTGRTGRVHRRKGRRRAGKEDVLARLPRRIGDGGHLQHAALERPDLVLRGEQLPDGPRAVPVRPAVLEFGLDAHAGVHAQLLPAPDVHPQQAARAGRHHRAGRADRHPQDQAAGVFHLGDRRSHRAVEEHLFWRHAAVRPDPLRARRLRSHRWHRQSAGGQQVRLLDQCHAEAGGRRRRSGSKAARSIRVPGGPTGSSGSLHSMPKWCRHAIRPRASWA
jgi:hypothetical protein